MANPPGIDQNELARVSALGKGKNQEDPAGGENALMELLIQGVSKFITALGRATNSHITSIAQSGLTTGAQSGLESPEAITSKKIMPSMSISGGDGFFFKIFLALKKSGVNIQDLTAGIERLEWANVSWSDLGGITPSITPSSGSGLSGGMDIA